MLKRNGVVKLQNATPKSAHVTYMILLNCYMMLPPKAGKWKDTFNIVDLDSPWTSISQHTALILLLQTTKTLNGWQECKIKKLRGPNINPNCSSIMTEQKIFYHLTVSDWIFIQLNVSNCIQLHVPFNNKNCFIKQRRKKQNFVFSQGSKKWFFVILSVIVNGWFDICQIIKLSQLFNVNEDHE